MRRQYEEEQEEIDDLLLLDDEDGEQDAGRSRSNPKAAKRSRVKKILLILLAVLLVLAAAGFFVVNRYLSRIEREPDDKVETLSDEEYERVMRELYGDDWRKAVEGNGEGGEGEGSEGEGGCKRAGSLGDEGLTNILLLGNDSREKGKRQFSDTMIVLSINTKTHKMALVSFMRDIWLPIEGYGWNKLNSAYYLGGYPLLKDTLENNFGLHLDGCVTVDFSQFREIVNALGGVDITLTEAEAKAINAGLGVPSNGNQEGGQKATTEAAPAESSSHSRKTTAAEETTEEETTEPEETTEETSEPDTQDTEETDEPLTESTEAESRIPVWTEPATEATTMETEPVTEPVTVPVPVTEPEPVTEAPTEAPEPVTEAPTEAPEPVTEAPEPVTEAPEPVTEAPEPVITEPETDAPEETAAPAQENENADGDEASNPAIPVAAAGKNHLNGDQALMYARLRSIDSDFSRTTRQRKLLLAIFDSLKSAGIGRLTALMNTVLPMVTTDMTNGELTSLAMQVLPYMSSASLDSCRVPCEGSYEVTMVGSASVVKTDQEKNIAYLKECLPFR